MEAISPLLARNTDHSVYYVCFIGAIYNTPTLNGSDIQDQLDQVIMALAERGLYNRAQVSDCAGSNVGYTNMVCNIPATNFIPMNVLDKHGLDGLCMVAYESYTDGNAVFGIDDMPHVC
jgi:hypothetical protein